MFNIVFSLVSKQHWKWSQSLIIAYNFPIAITHINIIQTSSLYTCAHIWPLASWGAPKLCVLFPFSLPYSRCQSHPNTAPAEYCTPRLKADGAPAQTTPTPHSSTYTCCMWLIQPFTWYQHIVNPLPNIPIVQFNPKMQTLLVSWLEIFSGEIICTSITLGQNQVNKMSWFQDVPIQGHRLHTHTQTYFDLRLQELHQLHLVVDKYLDVVGRVALIWDFAWPNKQHIWGHVTSKVCSCEHLGANHGLLTHGGGVDAFGYPVCAETLEEFGCVVRELSHQLLTILLHVHLCLHTHTHTHAHIHMHTYIHTHVHTHTRTHTYMYTNTHTHTHTHTHTGWSINLWVVVKQRKSYIFEWQAFNVLHSLSTVVQVFQNNT